MNRDCDDPADGLVDDYQRAFLLDEEGAPRDKAVAAVAPAAQLATIWDCPQLMKFLQGDKKVWTCVWCLNESDGIHPKPFLGWNVTKAISHVCCISGMCIRFCNGVIPPILR